MYKEIIKKSSIYSILSFSIIYLINTYMLNDKQSLVTLYVLFGTFFLFKAWINYLKDDQFELFKSNKLFKKEYQDDLDTIEKEDSTYSKISLIFTGLLFIGISFIL